MGARKSDPSFALNRASPEPLYRQLAARLEDAIRGGRLKPGDRLDSEEVLTRRFKVSRITLRQAVDDLVRKHLLVRKQGKGTFVTVPTVRHDLKRLHGMLGSLFAQAETASAKLLRYETRVPPEDIAALFGFGPKQPALAMDRLYLIGGRPMALAQIWLVPEVAKLTRVKADLISTEDMMREAGIRIAASQVSIRAAAAGAGIGKHLKISSRAPVLVLCRTSQGDDGKIKEIAQTWFCSDSYELICSTQSPNRMENLFDIRNVEEGTRGELQA